MTDDLAARIQDMVYNPTQRAQQGQEVGEFGLNQIIDNFLAAAYSIEEIRDALEAMDLTGYDVTPTWPPP